MTVKEKILEKLFYSLYEFNDRIKTASASEMHAIYDGIENITVLIMGLEGVNLNEVWKSNWSNGGSNK